MTRLADVLDRLVDRVERAQGLDRPADMLAALGARLKPGRVKDLLSGTPVGHPAHPVLVTVPLGAWTTAAVLDAGGAATAAAARRAVGFGVLAAAPAVATGLSDWLETAGAERRVGLVHAGVNDLGIGLFAASWWARRAQRHRLGVLLSSAGTVVVGLGGWLGGHLSYAQGVGVDTTAFQKAPADWTDVADLAELPGDRPVQVLAGGVPVLLVRRGDTVLAVADRCTHRGAPLSDGRISGDCIVCPWHGSRFALSDGSVRLGPATRPQPAYQARVHDGRVQVRRPDEQRSLRTNPAGV